MPVAWACHRPNAFTGQYSTSDDCVAQGIDETTLVDYTEGNGVDSHFVKLFMFKKLYNLYLNRILRIYI